jgi:hypothetical protein
VWMTACGWVGVDNRERVLISMQRRSMSDEKTAHFCNQGAVCVLARVRGGEGGGGAAHDGGIIIAI